MVGPAGLELSLVGLPFQSSYTQRQVIDIRQGLPSSGVASTKSIVKPLIYKLNNHKNGDTLLVVPPNLTSAKVQL